MKVPHHKAPSIVDPQLPFDPEVVIREARRRQRRRWLSAVAAVLSVIGLIVGLLLGVGSRHPRAPTLPFISAGPSVRATVSKAGELRPAAAGVPLPNQSEIAFDGPEVGLLAFGASGAYYGTDRTAAPLGSGGIQRTTDGGATWQTVWQQPGAVINWVGFIRGDQAAAIGMLWPTTDDTGPGTPILLRSANSGDTWSEVLPTLSSLATPAGGDPYGGWDVDHMVWTSPSVAFALAPSYIADAPADSPILRTTDGGVTWSPISLAGFVPTGGLQFVSATTGYLTVATTDGSCRGEVLATTDDGTTWQPLASSCVPYALDAVSFTSPEDGYVAGGNSPSVTHSLISFWATENPAPPYRVLLSTTDGGESWNEVSNSSTPSLPFQQISFTSSLDGFGIVGGCMNTGGNGGGCSNLVENGELLRTTTGGQQWTETGQKGFLFATASATRLWMLASQGGGPPVGSIVWSSRDSGARWHPYGVQSALSASTFGASGQTAFAQTNAGIAATVNGGRSWHLLRLPTTLGAEPDLIAAGPGHTVVLANDLWPGDELWVSHNDGVSGHKVTLPLLTGQARPTLAFSTDKVAVAITIKNTCGQPEHAAAGQLPAMLITTDGGARWRPVRNLPHLLVTGIVEGQDSTVVMGQTCSGRTEGVLASTTSIPSAWRIEPLGATPVCSTGTSDGLTKYLYCGGGSVDTVTLLVSHDGGKHYQSLDVDVTSINKPSLNSPIQGMAFASAKSLWTWDDNDLWRISISGERWTPVAVDVLP